MASPLSTPTFLHSFIPSFLHAFIPSFIPSLLHSFTPSLLHSFTPSLLHSFIPSFIHSLIPSFPHSFIPSFLSSIIVCQIMKAIENSGKELRKDLIEDKGTVAQNLSIPGLIQTNEIQSIVILEVVMTPCGQSSQGWPVGRSWGCSPAGHRVVGAGQGLEMLSKFDPIFDTFCG
jgi:hypothetical protein